MLLLIILACIVITPFVVAIWTSHETKKETGQQEQDPVNLQKRKDGTVVVPLRAVKHNVTNPRGRIPIIDSDRPDPGATVLEGGVRRIVYVYDDRPLQGMTSNHAFYLDLMDHDITMRSVTTGTVWNSASNGDIPLAYSGKPVGFLRIDKTPALKKAAKRKHIQIKAVWPGGIVSNVMRITALLPSNKSINDTTDNILKLQPFSE